MAVGFDARERAMWAGRAGAYLGSFAGLCAYPAGALLDAAEVGAGCRVLDVGTGPGTVAALAWERGAVVVAVDAEPSMVEAARRRVPGMPVWEATLPGLPFEGGSFDVAVANFVVNHVGDPAAAVGELRRVVRPGGRGAVTIWPQPAPPLQRMWGEVLEAASAAGGAGGGAPAATPDMARVRVDAGRDFARTVDGLAALRAGAGLGDVRCETVAWTHRVGVDDWWSGPANGLGALGMALDGQPAAVVGRVRRAYDQVSAAYLGPDGRLALPTAALLAAGTVTGP